MTRTTSHLAVLGLSNCREVQFSTGRLAITRYSVNANAMTALRYAGPSLWRTFAMAALRYGGPVRPSGYRYCDLFHDFSARRNIRLFPQNADFFLFLLLQSLIRLDYLKNK